MCSNPVLASSLQPHALEGRVAELGLGVMPRQLTSIVRILTVAALCFSWISCSKSARHPQLIAQIPHSVDVTVGEEAVGTITNAHDLVSLLRQGDWKPPHPCAARGQLLMRYATGETVRVSFYPGHSDSEYEFSVGGEGYAVARKPLMDTLQAAGIDLERILR